MHEDHAIVYWLEFLRLGMPAIGLCVSLKQIFPDNRSYVLKTLTNGMTPSCKTNMNCFI